MDTLTPIELQIMKTLWDAGKPLSCSQIVALSPADKLWKNRSVYGIVKVLVKEKHAIHEVGAVKNENGKYSGAYEPLFTSEEYYLNSYSELKRKNIPTLFLALIKDEELSEETMKELQEILDSKKRE